MSVGTSTMTVKLHPECPDCTCVHPSVTQNMRKEAKPELVNVQQSDQQPMNVVKKSKLERSISESSISDCDNSSQASIASSFYPSGVVEQESDDDSPIKQSQLERSISESSISDCDDSQ